MNAKLSLLIRLFVILTLIFKTTLISAQIETSGAEPVEENKGKNASVKSGTEFYVSYLGLKSDRVLTSNVFPWGEPLGTRSEEEGLFVNSFAAGMRSELGKNIYIDLGVGYFSNKTNYSFESADSSYKVTESFRHLGVPLKIAYISPGTVGFYLGIGVMPKAFFGRRTIEEITTNFAGTQENDFVDTEGFERVLIDFIGSAGLRADLSDKYGASLMLEGRRQLNSNFTNQGPYIRKSFHIGFSFGFQFYI